MVGAFRSRFLGCGSPVVFLSLLVGCSRSTALAPDGGASGGAYDLSAGPSSGQDQGASGPGDLGAIATGNDLGQPVFPDALVELGLAGRCVEVAGGATANGTAIQLGDCTGADQQRWLMSAEGSIRALGKCLDVPSSSTTSGTALQLWDCNGTGAQLWRLDGKSRLLNANGSNLCLAARGASDPGTRLEIATCSDDAHQKWVPPSRPVTAGRVVVYYQTQFQNGTYYSPLQLTANNTRVTDVLVAAFHLQGDLTVHLNDDPPDATRFAQMWTELHTMQTQGVRVLGMIGGAAQGSFTGLDKDFDHYYPLLKGIIDQLHLDGVDLDVEEDMSLAGIEKVIRQLRTDYGDRFVITLAPVAAALAAVGNLSGFDYEQLYRDLGSSISWLNGQFYNGWGSLEKTDWVDYIAGRGVFPPQKVVCGALTNGGNGGSGYLSPTALAGTVQTLVGKYPALGGVAGWEYFNSQPGGTNAPWQWAGQMATALGR